jgi:hypothetical protein
VPDFRREGEDYICSWDDPPYELVFNRVRTTDTRATAWAYLYGLDNGIRRPIMAPLSMALTEGASRDRLIKHLESRTTVTAKVWAEWVEQAINTTLLAVFEPEPLVDLSQVELKEHGGYLFDRVIPRGELTVLLADQRSSKSYLLLYLMVCVALDLESVFGRPLEHGAPIFYDTETTSAAHRRRLERIARGLGLLRLPTIHYRRMTGRLIDAERQIRADVAKIKPVMVGVDYLTYASGGNLNDSESAGATINLLGDLPESVTKVATAHHAKQHRGARLEDASVIGSGLFEFKASALWVLRKEHNDEDRGNFNVLMRNLKMRDGAEMPDIVYNLAFCDQPRSTAFSRGNTAQLGSLEKDLPARDRVLKMLAKAPSPLKTRDIAERLDLAESTVKKELNALAERNLATNINRSGGGPGNSGLWVAGGESVTVPANRSPIDKSNQNGSGAPDGANRSRERSDQPFRTVPGTVDPSRASTSGPPSTPWDSEIEELELG